MPDPSPIATAVARLSSDASTAQKIADALAESLEAEQFATSAFEEAPGRWSLAIHFRQLPNEAAVRALIASAGGSAAAHALVFETLAPTDWVRKSLEGLAPVEAGRFVVHGAHDRARVRANRIGIEIEAALAFGTGHHGTTRGCLLALDRIVKGRRARRRPRNEHLPLEGGGRPPKAVGWGWQCCGEFSASGVSPHPGALVPASRR